MRCVGLVALSIIVIPNNYSGVVKEVYGDATEIYGLGDDDALVWYDDFNGNSLDTSKWNNEGATGVGGYGNQELQDYEMEYCEVSNGNLIIKPQFQYNTQTAQNVKDSYYSTKLWTKNQFNFKYGKIEIRAKLPKGQGTWAGGWMLGNGGTWPGCGEIDIFETTSESSKTNIPQSIHCKRFNDMPSSVGRKHWSTTINTSTSEYHTYGAIWNDKKITFTVDGVPSGTYDPSLYTLSGDGTNDNDIWPFYNSAYLILNVAIGGTLGGNVTTDGWTMIDKSGNIETYQAKMYIDSVKVYRTKQDSSEVETTTHDSGSDNPDIGGLWQSYFGANDGSWFEGAIGTLSNNTESAFKADMTQVGWGGVWGGQVKKSINVKKGQKYNISFNAKSTKCNKYIYIKIATDDNLAKGFWVYLPKGKNVIVNEDFIAEADADQITFGIGGDPGDREGVDGDASVRYAIFDQQFAPTSHVQLTNLDCEGDFSRVTSIEISDYILSGKSETTSAETTKNVETTKNIETTNKTPTNNGITKNTKKTSIKSIKSKKKSLKVSWKRVAGVNGYQLQYSRKKSMKGAKLVTIKKATTVSKKIKKLKKKKKYYLRIRTFILIKGKKLYSPWSAIKAKKTK